jgi:hypothetical protein
VLRFDVLADEERSEVTRSMMAAALVVGLAAFPALAGGKKEGAGTGGGESQGAMWASLPGPREVVVAPPQISDSLGVVSVSATMWAGSGSAKCRVNFTIENYSSANVALGFVGRTYGAKDEVVDNWVVTVATLPPNSRTGRLFSCTLGAVEFMMVPISGFDWPPAKCVKAAEETEPCPLTLKITSTVPIILKKEEKKDDGKGKTDDKKGKH